MALTETARAVLDTSRWEDVLDYVGERAEARVGGEHWPSEFWLHVHFKAGRHVAVRVEGLSTRPDKGKPQARV